MAVLKFKDGNGVWQSIPAIQGASAYEQAVTAGYTGTLEDFYADLAALESAKTDAEAARDTAIAQAALAQGYAAQLAAGTASPAGTYANLAALTSANPDHGKIYITLDDGNWCYHNGSAWVAGGVYQAVAIADGSVTPDKATFLTPTKIGENIFDKNHPMTVGQVLAVDGTLAVNATYNTTDFIDVFAYVGQTLYCLSGHAIRSAIQYDENKDFVSGQINITSFLVGATTKYVRLSINTAYIPTYMLKAGSAPVTYVPYVKYYRLNDTIDTNPDQYFEKFPASANIFDKAQTLFTGILDVNGNQVGGYPAYRATGAMPVNPGTVYVACYLNDTGATVLSGFRSYVFLDKDQAVISGWSYGAGLPWAIVTPSNCYYLMVSLNATLSAGGVDDLMVIEGNYKPAAYVAYVAGCRQKPTYTAYEAVHTNSYHGLTIAGTGDSITQADGCEAGWLMRTANALRMYALNYGINGSTIARKDGQYTGVYADTTVLAAGGNTANKYYVVADNLIYEHTGGAWVSTATQSRTPIVDRYTAMSDDADLVVILGGSNDWFYAWSAFGEMTDRGETTFYGALHLLCLGLMAKYDTNQIVFMTPIKRADSAVTQNALGKTMADYVAVIKEVCAYYGIPVIDLFGECNLCPWIAQHNTDFFLAADYTHPNDAGHERMAKVITGKLRALNA